MEMETDAGRAYTVRKSIGACTEYGIARAKQRRSTNGHNESKALQER
jgi:hypothetical protein